MRAISTALFLVVLLASGRAFAQDPDVKGFDHALHTDAAQKGGKVVACASCHPTNDDGVMRMFPDKEHKPCANSGCHAPWPIAGATVEQGKKFCLLCHPLSQIKKGATKPFYPPFSVRDDYVVPFPHNQPAHAAAAYLCASCHAGHGELAPPAADAKKQDALEKQRKKDKLLTIPAHDLCAQCHRSGNNPTMDKCDGCHILKSQAEAARPPREQDLYRTSYRFSHESHAKHAGDDGHKCGTCHDNLKDAQKGQPMPLPPMTTCARCHDGQKPTPENASKKIFSVTGATCTRCHALDPQGGAAPAAAPPPPTLPRYSHTAHKGRGVSQDNCGKCHDLDAKSMPEAPVKGKDHAPCADSGCHKDEFFSRKPTICAGCHIDPRPFVAPRFVPLKTDSEFGRDFSHLAHIKGLGEQNNGFCERCHQGRFEVQPTAQSHAICAPCHSSDAAPKMNDCTACHALGAPRAGVANRDPSYQWYVRAKFQHDDHGTDPRSGQKTTCLLCHDQVVQAAKLADVGTPKMKQCDACHDGKSAFKSTGFECWRCHGSGDKK